MIVDEVSMVSLPLMSKLSDAIPLHARLILLGDRDQLASVEAGAVLGDICDTGREHGSSGNSGKHLSTLAEMTSLLLITMKWIQVSRTVWCSFKRVIASAKKAESVR